MSNYAQGWAWKQKVNATDKLILVALADHADDEGVCWPGLKGIAEKCGVTRRTVSASIHRLTESKHLSVEERHRPDGSRTSNHYLLSITSIPLEANNTTPRSKEQYPWQERGGGIEAEGGTGTQIETKENHQRNQKEIIINNEQTLNTETGEILEWPEWYSLGYGLKGWTIDFETAEKWRERGDYSQEYCLAQVYRVRSSWSKEKEKKGVDPYRVFQESCRQNWANFTDRQEHQQRERSKHDRDYERRWGNSG